MTNAEIVEMLETLRSQVGTGGQMMLNRAIEALKSEPAEAKKEPVIEEVKRRGRKKK